MFSDRDLTWDVGNSQPALGHDVTETPEENKVAVRTRLMDFSHSEVGNF